jgi:hypothetical protein
VIILELWNYCNTPGTVETQFFFYWPSVQSQKSFHKDLAVENFFLGNTVATFFLFLFCVDAYKKKKKKERRNACKGVGQIFFFWLVEKIFWLKGHATPTRNSALG